MNVLCFDFGKNFGDNWRGLLYLKALKAAHPDWQLTWWVTPQLHAGLGKLTGQLGFIDKFLIEPRTPRQTFELNGDIIKRILGRGLDFSLDNFPGGQGPDGRGYDKIIPTGEPWLTWKLIGRKPLDEPETINQGQILGRMLDLDDDQAALSLPLFGRRLDVTDEILVGLCRPDANDKKQVSRTRLDRIWEKIIEFSGAIAQVDYQDWYSPPSPPDKRVEDIRRLAWADKVERFNRARLFIGLDGGLNHFAAVCGTPTLSFYGHDPTGRQGRVFGPYPPKTPFGEHRYYTDFDEYLAAIAEAVA